MDEHPGALQNEVIFSDAALLEHILDDVVPSNIQFAYFHLSPFLARN